MMSDIKKIVMIGPVYPYTSGISHYTGLLNRQLRKDHDVTMVSYSFQYPKILYKWPQRDYENDTFKVEDTQYLIHTLNPFNWIKSAKKIAAMDPDLVLIQWWHPFFAPCYMAMIPKIRRRCKAVIMFTCHNVFPHERFPFDRLLTKRTLKKGNCYIVQSGLDEDNLKTVIKDPVYTRAVHPTYNAFKMQDMTKEEARRILGIKDDERVLLFFGYVRKYKGLDSLLEAMPKIIENEGDARYRLMVVGDFGESLDEYMAKIDSLGIRDHLDIHDGYIPNKDIEKFFAACDVVMLPYLSATQSGIVQIAFGFEKPVIATNVGGLPDVVADNISGLLVEPNDPPALADAVDRMFSAGMLEKLHEGVKKESYRFSWDRMSEIIEELFERYKKRGPL